MKRPFWGSDYGSLMLSLFVDAKIGGGFDIGGESKQQTYG
jgi:hypothetical protein